MIFPDVLSFGIGPYGSCDDTVDSVLSDDVSSISYEIPIVSSSIFLSGGSGDGDFPVSVPSCSRLLTSSCCLCGKGWE